MISGHGDPGDHGDPRGHGDHAHFPVPGRLPVGCEVYANNCLNSMPCLFQRDCDLLCHLSSFEDWESNMLQTQPGTAKTLKAM